MVSCNTILSVVAMLVWHTLAGARVPAEIDLYARSLDSLAAAQKRLADQRVRLNREITALSGGIDKLRAEYGGNLSPLKRMKLENLMADAKEKADSLTAAAKALDQLTRKEMTTLTDGLKMTAAVLERAGVKGAGRKELEQLARSWQQKLARMEEAQQAPAAGDGIDLTFNENDDIFTLQNKKLILDQWLAALQTEQDSLEKDLEHLTADLARYRTEKGFAFNPDDPDARERGDPILTDSDEEYSLEMRIKLEEVRVQEIKRIRQEAARLRDRITETITIKTK